MEKGKGNVSKSSSPKAYDKSKSGPKRLGTLGKENRARGLSTPAAGPMPKMPMEAGPSGASGQVQAIVASLSPEQQQLVTAVMSDPKVLEAIDQITEVLAPQVLSGLGGPAGQNPSEMMFGPKVA